MTVEGQHRVRLIINGQVQDAEFGQYTQQHALRLGLTGYIKNKRDHSVEVIAEGHRHNLNTLIEVLHQGPPSAIVRRVNAVFENASGQFDTFRIDP